MWAMGAPAITFLVTAIGYALVACPSLYWLDSGELAAASFELGIAHAPGQPLALLLGKLFCFLPLGDISFRVGLAQLYCGASAAAIVAWLGARVARPFVDDERTRAMLGVFAGLLYAGSYAAAFQAIRPEVYALSACLVLGAIALCLKYDETNDPRFLGLAGLCFGLGLCNHHYLTLLGAVPPAIAILWRRVDAPFRRGLVLGVVTTSAALLVYAYLPLRAMHDPIVDWGHPSSPSSFWWTITARSFQKSAGIARGGDLPALVGALASQLTPVAPLVALAGLYFCFRRVPRLGAALTLALLGPIGARLLVSFDAGNPDAYGYLSTAIAALALACVPLVAAGVQLLPVAVRPRLSVLFLFAAAALGVVRAPAYSLARFDDLHAIYPALLADAPPEGVVVPAYFQTAFALDYLRVAEGLRPDLSYLPRHFLSQPGVARAIVRRDPRLAHYIRDDAFDVDALLASRQRVLIEYDLDLDPRLVARATAIPVGFRVNETQSQRFVLWQSYLRLHQLCRLGAPANELAHAEDLVRRGTAPEETGPLSELVQTCASLRGR